MGLFGDGGEKAAKKAEQEEFQRQQRIKWGTAKVRSAFDATFNTPYYKTMEADQRKIYKTQIGDQYQQSLTQLQAALARTGLSSSSVSAKKGSDLQYQKGLAKQEAHSRMQNAINQRKGDVANAENTTLAQLANTADPWAAQAQAANLIEANASSPGYSPLGQLFTDATAGLATQADLERSNQNRYNMGVTNWLKPKSSVVNIRG
jgi:hypothetical protein